MDVILTKKEVENCYWNLDNALKGDDPSIITTVKNHGITGTIAFVYTVTSNTIGSIISAIIMDYSEDVSHYKKGLHRDAYKVWLDSMNAANFQAVKIRLFNYRDIADGVKFTEDIPNLIAYQDSNGNWISQY